MNELMFLVINTVLTLLGSGGLVAYINHRMQHKVALIQQELEARKVELEEKLEAKRLALEHQKADQDYGMQSLKEVLEVRKQESERLRRELDLCIQAQQDVSDLKRERDLLMYRLKASEDQIAALKDHEARYRSKAQEQDEKCRTLEYEITRLERESYQRQWKEDVIIRRVDRTLEINRELRIENRKLKQRLDIPTDDTAELPDLSLVKDVREFLRSGETTLFPDETDEFTDDE